MKVFTIGIASLLFFIGSTVLVYGAGTINSGKPVPYLGNNEVSAVFLGERIEKDYGGKQENWMTYTRNLCRTLSQLSPLEQQELWYGPS